MKNYDPKPKSDENSVLLPRQIKLQHLVRIKYQDADNNSNTHSFHGFFFKNNNDFKIIALGPFDVPIFQLEFKNNIIQYKFLKEQFKKNLADKIDLYNIAIDLWKIYFADKREDLTIFSDEFSLPEKNLNLIFNNKGLLAEKTFFDENNNILIKIFYQKYINKKNHQLPEKIHFKHIGNHYEIIIIMI